MLEKMLCIHNLSLFLISKYIIIYTVLVLALVILILFILLRLNNSIVTNRVNFNIFKNVMLYFFLSLLLLHLLKFLLSLAIIRANSYHSVNLLYAFEDKYSFIFSSYNIGLADSIVLLALITGIVCIFLLGDKHLNFSLVNIIFFCFFLLVTITMVYTMNLLVLFLSFEALFIPTIYFVYKLGYVKKTDKTIKYLLQWTLSGAFLIFIVICYIFSVYKTLNINVLMLYQFSMLEKIFIYFMLFVGFGIKIPVYPFHFWLTKVHVEAPAGFSIFLSGFLVKTAIYCFFFFSNIFFNVYTSKVILVIAILGIFDASIKMWSQLDVKKLIAFATIQEMNIILLFLVLTNNLNDFIFIMFIFVHGLLSALMFFIVDLIQKRTTTRNIIEISGLGLLYPKLRLIVWGILLFFMGFPLTIKFIIEWKIIFLMYSQSLFLTLIIFLILNVTAVIGFTKQVISILYGNINISLEYYVDLSKRDFLIIFFLSYFLFLLNFLSFYIL